MCTHTHAHAHTHTRMNNINVTNIHTLVNIVVHECTCIRSDIYFYHLTCLEKSRKPHRISLHPV